MSYMPQNVVSKGLGLLDEKEALGVDTRLKNWEGQVDLETLNIDDQWTCLLGQIFGDFYVGLRVLGLTIESAVDYGIIAPTIALDPSHDPEKTRNAALADQQHHALTAEWVRVIRERLAVS